MRTGTQFTCFTSGNVHKSILCAFVGRFVRELLFHSDPHTSTFFFPDAHSGWLDASGKEQVGTRVFSLLHRSISTVGLCGLDRTLGFLIMRDLNDLVRVYKRQVLLQYEALSY